MALSFSYGFEFLLIVTVSKWKRGVKWKGLEKKKKKKKEDREGTILTQHSKWVPSFCAKL